MRRPGGRRPAAGPLRGRRTEDAVHRRHGWNTFTIDETIAEDEVCELIDTSYDLIVAKLPKSKRPQV